MAVVFVLLAILGASLADSTGTSSVVVLNSQNFGEAKVKPTFVKFYAPWCGHCTHLAPTWDELAQEFNSKSLVTIAKVDCTVSSDVCNGQGIQGYPTLKLFHDGEVTDYNGGRTTQALSKFIYEQLKPLEDDPEGGLYVGTDANIDSLLSNGVSFVKFFAPWCGHCKNLAPTWQQLAGQYAGNSNVKVVHVDCTSNQAACQKHGVRAYPTLNIYKDGALLESYGNSRSFDDLVSFVNGHLQGASHEGGDL